MGANLQRIDRLERLAAAQHGYFTTQQAKAAGFDKTHHGYHVKNGHWLKIQRGLFRLPGFADSAAAEFTRWSLLSRNKSDQPQGVISHQSALVLHGLAEYDPNLLVHLTVPSTYHNQMPAGCVVHRADLNLSAIQSHGSFLATRPAQTLADLRPTLTEAGRWEEVVARARNELTLEELNRLGVIPAGTEPFPAWPQAVMPGTTEDPGPTSGPESQPPEAPALYTLLTEGVWKMICDRTPAAPASRRRAQAGFTLVELLVVVSIISALAAILLPALDKALATARAAQCANNQKQMALFVSLYADDNTEWLPSWTQWGGVNQFWWDKLRSCKYLTVRDTWTKLRDNPGRVTCCPEAGRQNWVNIFGALETPDSADWTPTTYGVSTFILGSKQWDAYGRPCRMGQIRQPSAGVLFVDAYMRPSYPWEGGSYFGYWNASHFATSSCGPLSMSPRHNGRVNAAHVDGHISTFLPTPAAFDEGRWKDMFPTN